MRSLVTPMICMFAVLSSGCSSWLDKPLDPNQSRVVLQPVGGVKVEAKTIDGVAVDDERFVLSIKTIDGQAVTSTDQAFDMAPGAHQLVLRYQFAVDADNVGAASEQAIVRNCQVELEYASFAAGQEYFIKARPSGFRPVVRLFDTSGQRLATAEEKGCRAAEKGPDSDWSWF